jgi:5'-phosphate synthase pdxT subunit
MKECADPLKTVGILALQGGFSEHAQAVSALGFSPRFARCADDTAGLKSFIIPGGESTVMLKLMAETGLDQWLTEFVRQDGKVFGTCAGMIVLAKLGLLDVQLERNAYGSQLDSFESEIRFYEMSEKTVRGIFIRAPRIRSVSPKVKALAHNGREAVLVRQDNVLSATFHPELGEDSTVHQYFLNDMS